MTYIESLEAELAASAAGYPGANEDLVTYVKFDMLKNRQAMNKRQSLIDIESSNETSGDSVCKS